MSGLTLSLRSPLSARVDLTGLVTGEWQKATAVEMAGRAARSADGAATVGDLFHVDGTPGDTITLRGDLSLADGIGTALAGGSVRIEGDAGDRAGASMTAGRIEIEGNAGRSAGEGMAGGALVIGGNCGSRAGAAAPGRKRGMTGGEVIILGNAGDEAGASMRRGLIVVGGRTGAFPCSPELPAPSWPAATSAINRRCGTSGGRSSASARSRRAPLIAMHAASSRSTSACCCSASGPSRDFRSRSPASRARSGGTAAISPNQARERFSHGVTDEGARDERTGPRDRGRRR